MELAEQLTGGASHETESNESSCVKPAMSLFGVEVSISFVHSFNLNSKIVIFSQFYYKKYVYIYY